MYDVKFATRGEIMLHKIYTHKYVNEASEQRKGIFRPEHTVLKIMELPTAPLQRPVLQKT
jgi:hypothetical protein